MVVAANAEEKTKPTVLNLVLLGANYYHLQSEKRHLLTEFASAINTQNRFVHILNGPDGVPDAKNPEAKNHPMTGTYGIGEIKLATDEKTIIKFNVAKQLELQVIQLANRRSHSWLAIVIASMKRLINRSFNKNM